MMRTSFASGESPQPNGVHILTPENGEVVASREILLQGMYARDGHDLVITSPEHGRYVIKNFFITEHPPGLADGHGLHIAAKQAADFAGHAHDQYAAAAPAAGKGNPIGQIRTLSGTATATHVDGTETTLKVGDLVYLGDILETGAGGKLGLVMVDGTSLALGEKGELVLDELVYDPATHGGKATLSLVAGAATFISGTIAKSGQDNMTFKTPVGTIGIRGTKVFASYDPVTGEIQIVNRPTGISATGQITAGEIFLTLPNGTPIGSMTSTNGGWQWNPQQGQAPQSVQLTEAQVQNVSAQLENTVNNIAPTPLQLQQQQQNQPGAIPGPSPTPTTGPAPAPSAGPTPGPAPAPDSTPAPAPAPDSTPSPGPAPAPGPTPGPAPAPTLGPSPSPASTPGISPSPSPGGGNTTSFSPSPSPSPAPAPALFFAAPAPSPTPNPAPTPSATARAPTRPTCAV